MIEWLLLACGGCVRVLNAYLSWLRYLLYRLRGGIPEEYRWVSGVPLIGSLFVILFWASRFGNQESVAIDVLAWSLVAIDSGGIHWFLISIAYHALSRRGKAVSNKPMQEGGRPGRR